MRVGVVHNLRPGGAHRRLAEQLRRLDADVVEVCLATATPVTASPEVVAYAERAPALPAWRRPPARYADLRALVRAWSTAAERLRGVAPDVVFANPCRFLQAPGALLEAPAPALYFCDEPRRADHDDGAATARRRRTRALYAPLYARQRALDRRATARAAALATNSAYTAAAIEAAYGREAAVLPMGVPEAMRPGGPAPGEGLLSVGPLHADKGHELAVRVASLSSRALRVVAIRAGREEEQRLRAFARRENVALELEVGVDDARLAAAYREAHATLCLSRAEPFGLVSLEAQACGCPVVVASEGGLPETILEGQTGWSAPRDARALAAVLGRLADPSLRARMSAAAARHGAGHTWARSARALQAALEAVAR